MKFEFKTENENFLKSFSQVVRNFFILSLLIISFDLAFKLGFISRLHHIEYKCKLLSVEKSASNFKKLSRLINLKSKQKIWEFCRNFVN